MNRRKHATPAGNCIRSRLSLPQAGKAGGGARCAATGTPRSLSRARELSLGLCVLVTEGSVGLEGVALSRSVCVGDGRQCGLEQAERERQREEQGQAIGRQTLLHPTRHACRPQLLYATTHSVCWRGARSDAVSGGCGGWQPESEYSSLYDHGRVSVDQLACDSRYAPRGQGERAPERADENMRQLQETGTYKRRMLPYADVY